MKKTSKTVVFFGNERLATGLATTAPTLRALIDAGYSVAALVIAQGEQGASRKKQDLEVAEVARRHAIPVLSPDKLDEVKDRLRELDAEAGIAVAYGKIIPAGIIDLFPAGILNIHPSLLPSHRGATPIESAILNGDEETGVSLMLLTPELDAGPLYAQSRLALRGQSKQQVADALLQEGAKLLLKLLPAIVDGSADTPVPQDESLATFDKRIQKQDGSIDWHKNARHLERQVRAYAGWPRSRTTLFGKEVIITKAAALDESAEVGTPGTVRTADNRLVVVCGQGALEVETLIPAGKKEMTGRSFLPATRKNRPTNKKVGDI